MTDIDSGIFTLIIMIAAIGLFLLWRIPIGRRIKSEEQEFIAQHINDNTILIFYGCDLRIGGWIFDTDTQLHLGGNHPVENIERIDSYYGRYTLAIPPGEYDSIAQFDYNYGNGTKKGGTGYTERIHKKLSLQKSCTYRYRLSQLSIIDKKQAYKTIFEETAYSTPMNRRVEHTVVFEQLL